MLTLDATKLQTYPTRYLHTKLSNRRWQRGAARLSSDLHAFVLQPITDSKLVSNMMMASWTLLCHQLLVLLRSLFN